MCCVQCCSVKQLPAHPDEETKFLTVLPYLDQIHNYSMLIVMY